MQDEQIEELRKKIAYIQNEFGKDMFKINENLTSLTSMVHLIYNSLKGNELSGDEGMVGNFKQMRIDLNKINEEITIIKRENNERKFYINIIWLAIGALSVLIIKYFLDKK